MTYTLDYNEKFKGAKFVANAGAKVRTLQVGEGVVHDCAKGEWYVGTGYYFYDSDGYAYMQTTTGYWYIVTNENASTQWTVYANAVEIPSYSRDDVQKYVDAMIQNNIRIVENNLFCARYADKLTADERKKIAQLQKRVMERQDAIRSNGFCEDIRESYPTGYADLEPYLAKLMKDEGIGLVWWAGCIIFALVVGGLAAASYFIYRDLFEESKEDVKWSDELTKTLMSKLTPEEYEQLQNETQGIVTKARLRAKLGSWGTVAKVAAVLVAGAFAYKFFFKQ